MADEIRNQFLRYRYGIFDRPETMLSVSSRQHSLCFGRTVKEVVLDHPDLVHSKAKVTKLPPPRFTISNAQAPKFVIVLENSLAMNNKEHWVLIEKALKKFIKHDLEPGVRVGLVLFNSGAHIAHGVKILYSNDIRESLTVEIKNKYSLSNKNNSCVRCGFMKAVEALQQTTSSSSMGGTVILISQGISTSLALDEEKELLDLAEKHQIQVHSIAIPR